MAREKHSSTSQATLGPRLADLYALLIGVFGVLVLIRLLDYQTMSFDLSTLLPFTLFALLVSYFRVPVGREGAELRLDGAILLGATLMAGPVIGGWAAFVTGLVTGLLPLPTRRPVRSSLLDHIVTGSLDGGRNVIAVGAAWIAYHSLGGILKPSRITPGLGLALILFCLSYVLIRSLLEWPFPLLKGAHLRNVLLETGNASRLLIEFIPLPIALLISPAFIQFGWVRVLILALVLVGAGALMHQMVETIHSLQEEIDTIRLSNRIKHALNKAPRNTPALCHLARQFCAEIVPAECQVGLYHHDRTQVMVQGGVDGSRASMMRIPITPFWEWMSRQQEPVLLDTRAQLDELELPLPALESGKRPQSALLVPILAPTTEREQDREQDRGQDREQDQDRDQEQPRGDALTEESASQNDPVSSPSLESKTSDHHEREEPAQQRPRSVGVLVLQSPFGNAFEGPVLERIQILVCLIGPAIHHAQMLATHAMQDADQRIALQIQADHLPQEIPALQDWDIAVRWELSTQATAVYSGFFRLADRDRFVMIEPCGHGLSAAITGLLIHTLIRSSDVGATLDQVEAMEAMNAYLMAVDRPSALLCATLDREVILTLINAGCASPLWWHSAHKHVEDLQSRGAALGLNANTDCEEKSIALAPDDVLLLCTGSLLDVSDGQETFGQKRLIQALDRFAGCPASELATAIMAQVMAFAAQQGNGPPSLLQHDILLAVFRRKGRYPAESGKSGKQDDLAGQETNYIREDTHSQDA